MEPQTATIKSVAKTDGVFFVRVELDAGGELDDVMLFAPAGLSYHPKKGDSCIIEYPYGIENNPIARSLCVAAPTTSEGDNVLFDDHGNELKLASGGVTLNSTEANPFVVGGTGASGLALASVIYGIFDALTVPSPETGLQALKDAMKIAFAPTGTGVTQTFKTK